MGTRDKIREILGAPHGEVLSGLTMLGVLVYSVSWFAYRGIYGELGLEAKDVGLTYSSILTSAALGIVMLLAASLLVLLAIGLIYGTTEVDPLFPSAPISLQLLYRLGSGIAVLLLLRGGVYIATDVTEPIVDVLPRIRNGLLDTLVHVAAFIVLLLLYLSLIGGAIAVAPRVLGPVARRARNWLSETLPLILVILIAALPFAVIIGPYQLGRQIGEEIREGKTTGLVDSLVIRWLLDVQVERVNIAWLGERGRCNAMPTRDILYLGAADGTTILYDPDTHTVCRTPTSSVQVVSTA
ncbi:hypothetical protein SAMN05660642_03052 [Geodermatophilus siccatus]|uniref:Uncharacterized protein n=1 Tax=Geodermatophilus siccatus TaxID=1137991 RepID=A0A1G9V251_9ACTN|nr:hypothetical protein [Geodermatophilus siccatus]SDM66198.1 hypothetical protein SAMN05660642_03052 [Geodermatophilus siccatus]